MTRRVIAFEGKQKNPNVFIEPYAMFWEEDELPIKWGFNNVERPCGRATELRREDDGTVTAELEFFDSRHAELVDNLIVNIYANPANGTTD